MKTAILLIGIALAVMLGVAEAQLAPPSGQSPPDVPDVAQSCTACHGLRGEGKPAEGNPRIAGLSQYYSAKQLRSFASGTRLNPAMEAIARSMSLRDVAVVSAYFAQIDAPLAWSAIPTSSEPGRLLATTGNPELGVQACNNCHGPGGTGEPPAIPYLAGQGASYLAATLNAWRAGIRRNDAGKQMAVIARALTPEAIVDVARYYSSLPPPQPRSLGLVRSPEADAGSDSVTKVGPPPTAGLATADPARGQAILAGGAHGCTACHTIPGVRAPRGIVGPPLDGVAARSFIAGRLPNKPDVLIAFLQNPPALVPQTGMPDTRLSLAEARDIAAYLYTLEPSHAP
jgi:cytochrome c553